MLLGSVRDGLGVPALDLLSFRLICLFFAFIAQLSFCSSFFLYMSMDAFLNQEMMEFQPFVPKEGHEAAFLFDQTPTYLFRLYTPK